MSSNNPLLPRWSLPATFASDVMSYRNQSHPLPSPPPTNQIKQIKQTTPQSSKPHSSDRGDRSPTNTPLTEKEAIAAIEKDGLVSFDPKLAGPPFYPSPPTSTYETISIFTSPLPTLDCEFNLINRRVRLRLRQTSYKRKPLKEEDWVMCDILSYQNKSYKVSYPSPTLANPILYPRVISLHKYIFEVQVTFTPETKEEQSALRRIKSTLTNLDKGHPERDEVVDNIRWYLREKRKRDMETGRGRHVAFGKVIFKDSKKNSIHVKLCILPEQTKKGRISGNHAPNEVLFYSPPPSASGSSLPPSLSSMMVDVPLSGIMLHSVLTTVNSRLNSPYATYHYVDKEDFYRPTLLGEKGMVEGDHCHKCRRFEKVKEGEDLTLRRCTRDAGHFMCKSCFPKNLHSSSCPVCLDLCGCDNCASLKWIRTEHLFGTQLGCGINSIDGTKFDTMYEQTCRMVKKRDGGIAGISKSLMDEKKRKDQDFKGWQKQTKKEKRKARNALLKKGDRISIYWKEDKTWYAGKIKTEQSKDNPYPRIKYDDGDEENIGATTKYKIRKSMQETNLLNGLCPTCLDKVDTDVDVGTDDVLVCGDCKCKFHRGCVRWESTIIHKVRGKLIENFYCFKCHSTQKNAWDSNAREPIDKLGSENTWKKLIKYEDHMLPLAFTLPQVFREEMTRQTPPVESFGLEDTFEALLSDDEVDTIAQIQPAKIRKAGMLVKSSKFNKDKKTGKFIGNVPEKKWKNPREPLVRIEYCGKVLTLAERDVLVAEKNIDNAILPLDFVESGKKVNRKIKVGLRCRAMWEGKGKYHQGVISDIKGEDITVTFDASSETGRKVAHTMKRDSIRFEEDLKLDEHMEKNREGKSWVGTRAYAEWGKTKKLYECLVIALHSSEDQIEVEYLDDKQRAKIHYKSLHVRLSSLKRKKLLEPKHTAKGVKCHARWENAQGDFYIADIVQTNKEDKITVQYDDGDGEDGVTFDRVIVHVDAEVIFGKGHVVKGKKRQENDMEIRNKKETKKKKEPTKMKLQTPSKSGELDNSEDANATGSAFLLTASKPRTSVWERRGEDSLLNQFKHEASVSEKMESFVREFMAIVKKGNMKNHKFRVNGRAMSAVEMSVTLTDKFGFVRHPSVKKAKDDTELYSKPPHGWMPPDSSIPEKDVLLGFIVSPNGLGAYVRQIGVFFGVDISQIPNFGDPPHAPVYKKPSHDPNFISDSLIKEFPAPHWTILKAPYGHYTITHLGVQPHKVFTSLTRAREYKQILDNNSVDSARVSSRASSRVSPRAETFSPDNFEDDKGDTEDMNIDEVVSIASSSTKIDTSSSKAKSDDSGLLSKELMNFRPTRSPTASSSQPPPPLSPPPPPLPQRSDSLDEGGRKRKATNFFSQMVDPTLTVSVPSATKANTTTRTSSPRTPSVKEPPMCYLSSIRKDIMIGQVVTMQNRNGGGNRKRQGMVISVDDVAGRVGVVFNGIEESRPISSLLVIDVNEADIDASRLEAWKRRLKDHKEALLAVKQGRYAEFQENKKQKNNRVKQPKTTPLSTPTASSTTSTSRDPDSTQWPRVPKSKKAQSAAYQALVAEREQRFKFQDQIDVVWELDSRTHLPTAYMRISDDVEEKQVQVETPWKDDLVVDGVLFESQDGRVEMRDHVWGVIAQADLNKATREAEEKKKSKRGDSKRKVGRPPKKKACSRELPFERAKPLATWSASSVQYSDNNRNLHLCGKDTENGDASGIARANRVNKRRDFEESGVSQERDPMHGRGAKVKFARSIVHGWGVFADEDIKMDGFVLEYVGEMIRESVAERRQEIYEKEKVDDYMFRLGKSGMVIDATKRGGVARYLNHSCNPNCFTKEVEVGGMLRIAIYAKRDILRGEEMTYDYMFEREMDQEKKLRCGCGEPNCVGWMN